MPVSERPHNPIGPSAGVNQGHCAGHSDQVVASARDRLLPLVRFARAVELGLRTRRPVPRSKSGS